MRSPAKFLQSHFPICLRDSLFTAVMLLGALWVCFFLRSFDESTVAIPMISILAVFLISRFTTGYCYGSLASLVCVLAVNYVFTYPYFAFNFTLAGYPVTMLSMLAVSIITSALTTQIKQQEAIQIEVEREKTRSNLLRSVSHDLRTPLTSILGASSAIKENDTALTHAERVRLLSEIQEDARWLIRMVENLLTVTRIDPARDAGIQKCPEAAEEVIAEAIQKFKKNFPEAAVSVTVPDALLMIPMDSTLIVQVLLNLLENAVIHSKTATRTEVSVVRENTHAVFTVSDNGCGIKKELLPHIFDGYTHGNTELHGDTKRNMGIGLSVCSAIVRVHGGSMTAENSSRGGAVFRFTLPLEGMKNGA